MFNGFSFSNSGFIKIDPRTKMILFALCSFAVLREPRFLFQGFLFAFAYLLLINGKQYGSAQKMLLIYAIMVGIDYALKSTHPNNAIAVLLMGIMIFRMFIPVIMLFMLMIRTTKVSEFMVAFDKMHVPQQITIPFSVMFRFFPTVGEELTNIQNAMKFRGFALNLKNIFTKPALVYECTIVPLLSDAVIIADEISAASLCRGLGGTEKRTSMVDVKMRAVDYLLIVFALLLNINANISI